MLKKNIVKTASNAGSFNTLVTAVKSAELVETLSKNGPFTVFAPTDEAFSKVPKKVLEDLLKDKSKLSEILTYHVIPGKIMSKDVVRMTEAKTVQGKNIKIDSKNGVMINNARVIKTDIGASNGVIHVIDTVLMPN